jgi:uncharacterized BrkB/YihY/UPF0761 family membrane protein
MDRRLLVLIPLFAVAMSLTSLVFAESSAGQKQRQLRSVVDSATARSS